MAGNYVFTWPDIMSLMAGWDGYLHRLLNPLTKTQKEILGKLDVPEDFVDNLV